MFVHLHNHSEFSLLDGMGKAKEIPFVAAKLGQDAVAITDHGSLAGCWAFAHAAKEVGVKPILGIEAYLAIGDDRFNPQDEFVPAETDPDAGEGGTGEPGTKRKSYHHLTLLAATPTGWINLVRLNNAAAQSVRYKPLMDTKLLAEHAEGLICLTGCLGGPVAGPASRGDIREAKANLKRLIEIFGSERVFVEVMDHDIKAESDVAPKLAKLASQCGVQLVATNDCHYLAAEHTYTHEIWLATQSKRNVDDPKAFKFNGTGYHMRSETEMLSLRDEKWWVEACENTQKVADLVDEWVLPTPKLRLPHFELPDGFETEKEYMHHLVLEGARKRWGKLTKTIADRLRTEEDVIDGMGMCGYMLIVADYVSWAKTDLGPDGTPGAKKPILVGPGRGSAAGSATAYALGITNIDPIRHELLFERFLEPGRVGMPDIDVDFEQNRADEVIEYLRHKYGADHIARIGTVTMSRTKAALKQVASRTDRAAAGNRLAALVPLDGGKPYPLAKLDNHPQFVEPASKIPESADIIKHAKVIENTVTSASIHPCGVIISDEPLDTIVPMRLVKDVGWVTCWDGTECETLGLLKVDILRLRNLDIITSCLELAGISANDLPDPDDPNVDATFAMLRAGATQGVFQLDSEGMTRLVTASGPQSIDDLTALVALYRPGPMEADSHTSYADRASGAKAVNVDNYTSNPREAEILLKVFNDTYGLPVYQEQIMRLAATVADFSVSETSKLRKAMGKKNAAIMNSLEKKFIDGGIAHSGFNESTLNKLFSMIRGAGKYLFNKSHAAAYAYLAFITAWLKCNYPAAFAAATLAHTPKGDKRQVVLDSLPQQGLKVVCPDVNTSMPQTRILDETTIQLGLADIAVAGNQGEKIVEERTRNGPYKNIADLKCRTRLNVGQINAIIEAGAADSIDCGAGRLGMVMIDTPVAGFRAEWSPIEKSARQYRRLGVEIGASPLDGIEDLDKLFGGSTPLMLDEIDFTDPPRGKVFVLGVVRDLAIAAYSKGQMARFTFAGRGGVKLPAVIWDDALRQSRKSLIEGRLTKIVGRITSHTREVEVTSPDGETYVEKVSTRQITVEKADLCDSDAEAEISLPPLPENVARLIGATKNSIPTKPMPKPKPKPRPTKTGRLFGA